LVEGSLTNAALGAESATGVGTPELEVTQRIPSGLTALLAVHPAGKAGTTTLSKFSAKVAMKLPHGGVGVGDGVGDAVGVGVGVGVTAGVAVGAGVGVGQNTVRV
jgi:hypothetical protein